MSSILSDNVTSSSPSSVSLAGALNQFATLWRLVPKEYRRGSGFLIVLMITGAAAELITLGAVIPFLGMLTGTQSNTILAKLQGVVGEPSAAQISIIFIIIVITSAAVRLVLLWYSVRYTLNVGHGLTITLYKRVLSQPYHYHLLRNTSETLAGIQKAQTVTMGVLLPLFQAASGAVIAAAIVAMLFLINPWIAIVSTVVFGGVYGIINRLTRKRLHHNSIVYSRLQTASIQAAQEGIGGIREIILDASQLRFVEKFRLMDAEMLVRRIENTLIAYSPRMILEAAGMCLIAIFALFFVSTGQSIVGLLPILGAMALGAQRLLPLAQQIYLGGNQLKANYQQIVDLRNLIEALPGEENEIPTGPALPFDKEVRFESVCFRYSEDAVDTLRDVSFVINKGERIGIVGPTGAGKSTVIDLLMGLLEPTKGRILVDGQELRGKERRRWRLNVTHVPQAIFLADASIAQNIAFGENVGGVEFSRLLEAATRACLADHIRTLDRGFETMVGEHGVRLSGGQRQRLGIARAIYRDAPLMVLDEATSALDEATEREVMARIDAMDRGKTLVIIAHRTATLAGCDRILRFEAGRLVREGKYADVIGPL